LGYQRRVIARRMAEGKSFEAVTAYVAPPGYSQHETGRAVDLTAGERPFAQSATYRWLRQNAADYGFVETYPKDSPGPHPWEPWHWYFTAPEEATE
jgi:D-alanyl-D-alanine carboxypeptidase